MMQQTKDSRRSPDYHSPSPSEEGTAARTRTDDDIKLIIEGAFKPLRCVAEVWDYGERFRFWIYGPNDKILIQFSELTMREAHSDGSLLDLLIEVRRRAERRGHQLQPWHFPGA